MDLKDFLQRYPEVRVATSADDGKLQAFFHRAPMKGKGLQLLYRRDPTFCALLECHSNSRIIFYLESIDGKIEGAATFVFRDGWVRGQRQKVAYLGDLRIENARRWGRYWREFYKNLMLAGPEIREFGGTRYFLTAIMKQNTQAQKSLAESKIGYRFFHSYKMVNIPRAWRPSLDHFKAECWTEVPENELWAFYDKANQQKPLGWTFDEFHHEGRWRLNQWKGLTKQDGFVLRDSEGIAVSGAFWYPGEVKKIMVQKMPTAQRIALTFLRPFLSMPQEGEELRCLYLTTLDKRENLSERDFQLAMRQLIKIGLKIAREKKCHCVSLAEFDKTPLTAALRPYIALKTDLELYFVDPKRNPVSDFNDEVPGFEMGLV